MLFWKGLEKKPKDYGINSWDEEVENWMKYTDLMSNTGGFLEERKRFEDGLRNYEMVMAEINAQKQQRKHHLEKVRTNNSNLAVQPQTEESDHYNHQLQSARIFSELNINFLNQGTKRQKKKNKEHYDKLKEVFNSIISRGILKTRIIIQCNGIENIFEQDRKETN